MKKQFILTLTFLIIPIIQSFSINNLNDTTEIQPQIDSISKIEYYNLVEIMPEFQGGKSEMLVFFAKNFKYPSEIDACCRVTVEFIVDSMGQLRDIKILKGLQIDFDKETLRVMRLMPKWKPGELNGKPVNVKIIMPWNISIQ